jgi:uncharacterized protein (TIGR03083 family)
MTLDRAGALAAEREIAVRFLAGLTPDEWAAPSACAGWSVQDVVAHLGASSKGFFTPWLVSLVLSRDVEGHNDNDVAKRRSWPAGKVLAEYVTWSRPAGRLLRLLQLPVLGAAPIPLAELGTYPGRLFASAICFDTLLHVRHDIAGAIGRADDLPEPSTEALRVSAEWMVHGIPAMSQEQLGWLDRPVELKLEGRGASTWRIAPGGRGGRVVVQPGPAADAAAAIAGDAGSFPVWGSGRAPWREHGVQVTAGDEELGTRFLDTVRII